MKPVVIFSAGNEINSVSLAYEFSLHQIPYFVVRFGEPSLIRDTHGIVSYLELDFPPCPTQLNQLKPFLDCAAQTHNRLPYYPTDDSSLRFISEHRNELESYLLYRGSPLLRMNGLDKAEFFDYFARHHPESALAPTRILRSPQEADCVLNKWGKDVIFKPSIKPISMELPSAYNKVLTKAPGESRKMLIERLERAWHLCDRWVAQPRLKTPLAGEAVFYGARLASGQVIGMTVEEKWKHPRIGGTACWVEACPHSELIEITREILGNLQYCGLAECAYLKDDSGRWCLLELNPRPWLQIGLPAFCGLPIAKIDYEDTIGQSLSDYTIETAGKSWILPERMLLSLLKRDYGPLRKTIPQAFQACLNASTGGPLHYSWNTVRWRWALRMLKHILSL